MLPNAKGPVMSDTTEVVKPFCLAPNQVPKYTSGAISRTKVFDLIKSGEVQAHKLGRRTAIITRSIDEYIERQPRGPNFEASERSKTISTDRIAKRSAAE
jgi:hypothetical protein